MGMALAEKRIGHGQAGNPPLAPGAIRAGRAETARTILAATIRVIAEHSLSGTTIERVAQAAGIAPATVILHFKRKEALLIAALDHVAIAFETARRRAMAEAAGDPAAALRALIDLQFDPDLNDPARIAVWYAFWGEAGSRRLYMDRVGRLDRAYQDDIEFACRSLIAAGCHAHLDAEAVALGFAGLLEALWQEMLLAGPAFDRARARRLALSYLAGLFPEAFAGD